MYHLKWCEVLSGLVADADRNLSLFGVVFEAIPEMDCTLFTSDNVTSSRLSLQIGILTLTILQNSTTVALTGCRIH